MSSFSGMIFEGLTAELDEYFLKQDKQDDIQYFSKVDSIWRDSTSMLRHDELRRLCVLVCFIMLYMVHYVTLRSVTLCNIVLWYVVLRYVILHNVALLLYIMYALYSTVYQDRSNGAASEQFDHRPIAAGVRIRSSAPRFRTLGSSITCSTHDCWEIGVQSDLLQLPRTITRRLRNT